MNALVALRKVIAVNKDGENVAEIREYVEEHIVELAQHFGVTPETITDLLASVSDDSVLATKMLETIRNAEATLRDTKTLGRARAAQVAADKLGSSATWDGERVQLDVPAILSSVLTKRDDLIVFASDGFTTSVYQAMLFDLARLKRRDLSGFVDSKGLHIRWRTGGLNLRSQVDPHADRVVMNLSSKRKAEAA